MKGQTSSGTFGTCIITNVQSGKMLNRLFQFDQLIASPDTLEEYLVDLVEQLADQVIRTQKKVYLDRK